MSSSTDITAAATAIDELITSAVAVLFLDPCDDMVWPFDRNGAAACGDNKYSSELLALGATLAGNSWAWGDVFSIIHRG